MVLSGAMVEKLIATDLRISHNIDDINSQISWKGTMIL